MIPRFLANHPRSFGAGAGAAVGAGAGAAAGDPKDVMRNALIGAGTGAALGGGAGHLHLSTEKAIAKSVSDAAQQAARTAPKAGPSGGLPARAGASAGLGEMAEHAKIREQAHNLLGKHSTKADFKASFRRLALENHPDRHPGDANKAAKFKEVNDAWSAWRDHPEFQKLSSYFDSFFRELRAMNAR